MSKAVTKKKVDIHLTMAQLKVIQYAGVLSWGYEENCCPVCGTAEKMAHREDCWIGSAMKRLKKSEVTK
jgi:hypothetical protein